MGSPSIWHWLIVLAVIFLLYRLVSYTVKVDPAASELNLSSMTLDDLGKRLVALDSGLYAMRAALFLTFFTFGLGLLYLTWVSANAASYGALTGSFVLMFLPTALFTRSIISLPSSGRSAIVWGYVIAFVLVVIVAMPALRAVEKLNVISNGPWSMEEFLLFAISAWVIFNLRRGPKATLKLNTEQRLAI